MNYIFSIALISVDGEWGQWSPWSKCTAACNGGKRSRHHFCDSPSPAHGGKDCVGSRHEDGQCNTEICPSKFRVPFDHDISERKHLNIWVAH